MNSLTVGLFLLQSFADSSSVDELDSPPNLILIIADDMAWNDCGVCGHLYIKTPNIDKLAGDGMMFHQAFLTTSSWIIKWPDKIMPGSETESLVSAVDIPDNSDSCRPRGGRALCGEGFQPDS